MRRLLVVAYYTPPLGLSGVMRVTKLCKYLPEVGWRPLILTVKPAAYYHYDPAMLADLAGSTVYRTESVDPARMLNWFRPRRRRLEPVLGRYLGRGPRLLNHLLFPDSKVGWLPFAEPAGRRIIREQRPDAVFATGPPFTTFLLGLRFKAFGHLPLVCDFRDPWPTGFEPPPAFRRSALRELRNRVTRHADLVLAVNEGTARQVGNATVLDNGFDPAEFDQQPEKLDGLSVVHVGNLWQNQEQLLALARALETIPGARLYLVGKVDRRTGDAVRAAGRATLVGTVSHDRACRLMKSADVLLYVGKPSQPVGLKLYEYLGARRPILVTGPDADEAGRIVVEAGAGLYCDRPDGVAAAVLRLKAEELRFAGGDRDRYDRRQQARWLADRLERLVTGG